MATRLTTLDVVNACLSTMGETPLNAVDVDHPFVQAALNSLNTALTTELGKGWGFNTDIMHLVPEAETNCIFVPDDALNVNTDQGNLVMRGRRLYDADRSTYDMTEFLAATGTSRVRATVIRYIPFEDLPAIAQYLIRVRTMLLFQPDYDADQARYQELAREYAQIKADLSANDIRNAKANMFRAPGVLSKMNRIRPAGMFSGLIRGRYE